MHSSIASAALLGLSYISSLAVAAPLDTRSTNSSDFKFPLANNFPTPNSKAVDEIQEQAHGTLPNGLAPSPVSADGLANLRLLAFNEIFEVAFFTQLLDNVTAGNDGFQEQDFNGQSKELVINELTATQAQEELHALDVNGALLANQQDIIVGCEYNFPVNNFQEAIALAALFTDVVLGTLQDVNEIFAKNNDSGLVRAISSVISQEGQQDGFYRILQQTANQVPMNPNALPFLTSAARNFAFTAVMEFVIPNTCDKDNMTVLNDDFQAFIPLTVVTTPILPQTQELEFGFSLMTPGAERYHQASMVNDMSMVYINQQNNPIVQPIQGATYNDTTNMVTFTANFPYSEYAMNGLTIAAVAPGTEFNGTDDVAAKALIAPGLIEVN